MKNIRKIAWSCALLFSILPLCATNTISAQAKESYSTYYPMACGGFEVDVVNDNGQFDQVGCYNSFDEANTVMKRSGNDAVVRHSASYSPTKIIAMNAGIAYAYPMRDGSITLNLNQYNGNKDTYMPKHRELYYFSTLSYDTDGNGTIHANVTDFDATVSLKDVDLIPFKFITNNLNIYLGGNDTTEAKEAPFLTKARQSYYQVEQNGNYKELRFVAYSGWAVNGNEPSKVFNTVVGPAAPWINVGDVYYSYNDYDFYTDRYCTNKAGTYYNYYEFLPLRQKSNIDASAYNLFLQQHGYGTDSVLWDTGQLFVDAQNTYGINALMLFAQAACESAWGTSNYAKTRYNLFGYNAFDSDPDQASTFDNVKSAIEKQAGLYLREYLNTNDYRFFGSHYGNKGSGIGVKYASSTYYGLTLASIAYSCDKIYNGEDGNLSEYNAMPIGVVNTYGVGIYDAIDGNIMYTTAYGSTYQKNYTVTILEENGDWYKVQSVNYLQNGKQFDTAKQPLTQYDWNNVGWIEKKYVTQIGGNAIDSGEENATSIGTVTVNVENLRIRNGAGLDYAIVGISEVNGTYYVYDQKDADGYTWYRIGDHQWIASKENWVTYTPNQEDKPSTPDKEPVISPSEDIEPAPATTYESIDALEENRKMIASLKSVSFDENTHVVTITGLALFRKMDALEGQVKHDLILTDPQTKKALVVPCKTENYAQNLLAGYTTQAVQFSCALDLDDFSDANYYVGIRVTNNDTTGYYSFLMNGTDKDISYKKEDGTLVKLFADANANYRYTLSAEKQSIDVSVIHKPSSLIPKFGTTSLVINDGRLQMNGYAGIYQTDFTDAVNPTYKLLLEDATGNVVSFDTTLAQQQRDMSKYMKCNATYTKTWFTTDADLTQLAKGTYRIYIDVSTTSARDIFEMYNLQGQEDITCTKDGRTYTLQCTNVRSRYILTIQ